MASRSSDPARVREKILKIAVEEFGRIGFEGARVDRIAERCKFSKNMLYYYFKSKEGLFVAALERVYSDIRERQRDVSIRMSDPILAMRQLVEHTFSAFEDSPDAIRLMNEENKHRGKLMRKSKRIREMYNPLVETIGIVLERGCQQGIFRASLDPTIVYLTLSSLCYHYLSNRYTLEVALDKDLSSVVSRSRWLDHVTDVVVLYCVSDPAAIMAPPASARRPAEGATRRARANVQAAKPQ